MTSLQIFALQLAFSLVVFSLIAIWYVAPGLRPLSLRDSLPPLLLFNAMRVLGLIFLVPQVIDPRLPYGFAAPGAFGDLIAASLALLCAILLRANAPRLLTLTLVWLFNIEETLDLLNALARGVEIGLQNYQLGAAWFIPTVYVPALLVTHALIFVLLIAGRRAPRSADVTHALSATASSAIDSASLRG